MTKTVKLIEMAKLTSGQTMTRSDEFAVSMDDKLFVKHNDAFYPVIFEDVLVHKIKLLLHGAKTDAERAQLQYLAYDLGFEDELNKEN